MYPIHHQFALLRMDVSAVLFEEKKYFAKRLSQAFVFCWGEGVFTDINHRAVQVAELQVEVPKYTSVLILCRVLPILRIDFFTLNTL